MELDERDEQWVDTSTATADDISVGHTAWCHDDELPLGEIMVEIRLVAAMICS